MGSCINRFSINAACINEKTLRVDFVLEDYHITDKDCLYGVNIFFK